MNSLSTAPSCFVRLLPADAVVVEATPSMWGGGLNGAEAAAVVGMVEKRRGEFTAGRNAARAALRALGIAVDAIPVGTRREPMVPPGVALSITHVDDYCAAAAIRTGVIGSLGIDAERNELLPIEARSMVATPDELRAIEMGSHHGDAAPSFDLQRLVFSAKESFYKAYSGQHPLFLEFHDVRITSLTADGRFAIRVLNSNAPAEFRSNDFEGRYAIDDRRLYTAIALPNLDTPGS